MDAVLLSTFMFIPSGETEVIKIRFYLSSHTGIWNVDNNNVYVDQSLWNRWRDCMNHPQLQKRFFDELKKVSTGLIQ